MATHRVLSPPIYKGTAAASTGAAHHTWIGLAGRGRGTCPWWVHPRRRRKPAGPGLRLLRSPARTETWTPAARTSSATARAPGRSACPAQSGAARPREARGPAVSRAALERPRARRAAHICLTHCIAGQSCLRGWRGACLSTLAAARHAAALRRGKLGGHEHTRVRGLQVVVRGGVGDVDEEEARAPSPQLVHAPMGPAFRLVPDAEEGSHGPEVVGRAGHRPPLVAPIPHAYRPTAAAAGGNAVPLELLGAPASEELVSGRGRGGRIPVGPLRTSTPRAGLQPRMSCSNLLSYSALCTLRRKAAPLAPAGSGHRTEASRFMAMRAKYFSWVRRSMNVPRSPLWKVRGTSGCTHSRPLCRFSLRSQWSQCVCGHKLSSWCVVQRGGRAWRQHRSSLHPPPLSSAPLQGRTSSKNRRLGSSQPRPGKYSVRRNATGSATTSRKPLSFQALTTKSESSSSSTGATARKYSIKSGAKSRSSSTTRRAGVCAGHTGEEVTVRAVRAEPWQAPLPLGSAQRRS